MVVYIFGFPHCGTTILRHICCRITGYHEVWPEVYNRRNIDQMETLYGDNIVFKSPYPKLAMGADKSIFILRDPRYVFHSIERRFNQFPSKFPLHTIDDYESALSYFISYDGFKIKYENMFDPGLQHLFEYLEVPYDPSKLTITGSSDPEPSHDKHGERRWWQVHQPFINRNVDNENSENVDKMNRILEMYINAKDSL